MDPAPWTDMTVPDMHLRTVASRVLYHNKENVNLLAGWQDTHPEAANRAQREILMHLRAAQILLTRVARGDDPYASNAHRPDEP